MKNAFLAILSALVIFQFICNRKQENSHHTNSLQATAEISTLNRQLQTTLDSLVIIGMKKDSLAAVKDTVIIQKYDTIIRNIPFYQLPDFANLYDSVFGVQLYLYDSLGCMTNDGLTTVTTTIYKGKAAKERLANCQERLLIRDTVIHRKDSIIDLCREDTDNWKEESHTQAEQAEKERLGKRIWKGIGKAGIVSAVLHFFR